MTAPPRKPAFDLEAHDPAGAEALAAHAAEERRRGVRPVSLHHRAQCLRGMAQRIAPTSLLAVTPEIAEQWWASLDGLTPASRATYLNHARAFYRWTVRRRWMAVDPVAEIATPRVPQGLPRPIPEGALELALVTAGQPLRAWLVLAGFVGLRAGEIARLRREHVHTDRDPALLHVVDGKGGRERVVPLSAAVLAELAPHLTGRRGPLWLTERRNPAEAVTKRVGQHLRQLGLPFNCHSLRHRFGSQVYQRSGGDLRLTQDLLGHASPATTAIYAAWDPARATGVVDDLAGNLGRAAPVIRPDQG